MWPGVPVVPIMSTGATDGLYLRNAGIPVYGVSGIFGDIDDVRAHGQDERQEVRSFFEGMEMPDNRDPFDKAIDDVVWGCSGFLFGLAVEHLRNLFAYKKAINRNLVTSKGSGVILGREVKYRGGWGRDVRVPELDRL